MSPPLPPLGVAHFSCIETPPADFVRMAAEAGFGSVGLRLHPAFPGAPFYPLPLGSPALRETQQALRLSGLSVYDIEFVVLDEDFEPSALSGVIETAAELGARRLSVCGDDPDRERFVANLSALAEMAAASGLGIDLEIMPWRRIGTLAAAVGAVQSTGLPNVGVLVDALHLARSGSSPADLSGLPEGLIRSVQLCDARAERPVDHAGLIAEARGGRLLPGHGTLPLTELVRIVPPDATLSVEVPKGPDPGREHLRALFETASSVLEAARPTG